MYFGGAVWASAFGDGYVFAMLLYVFRVLLLQTRSCMPPLLFDPRPGGPGAFLSGPGVP